MKREFTQDIINKIIIKRGPLLKDIAKEFGLTESRISQLIRKNNIIMPPKITLKSINENKRLEKIKIRTEFLNSKGIYAKYYLTNRKLNRLAKVWKDIKSRTGGNSTTWHVGLNYKNKGIINEFISFNDFVDECIKVEYPKIEQKWITDNKDMKSLHCDRIDNSEGYKPNNIQFISSAENLQKDRRGKK